MAADHLRSSGVLCSWGSPHLRSTYFVSDPRGHGWHLDRFAFDAMLRSYAIENGARLCVSHGSPRIAKNSSNGWAIAVDAPELSALSAEWIVDCTGRQSWFASRLGVRRIHCDRQIAFVLTLDRIESSPEPQLATVIEAVSHGWWYTSPVPGGNHIVAYLTDPSGEYVRSAKTGVGLLALLSKTRHIRRRFEINRLTVRSHAPIATAANSSRLGMCWGDKWAAAGDACMSFDPLSSQGLFHALYSGVVAGRALLETIAGDAEALARYQRRLDAVYDAYLCNREFFYSLEQRWPCNQFWAARQPGRQDEVLLQDNDLG